MKRKRKPTPLTMSNRQFFQVFYEQYKDFLLYIAARYSDNPTEKEDLVQEALVRLMKNTDVLRELCHGQRAKYIELTVRTVFLDMEQARSREKLLVLDNAALEALLEREQTPGPDPAAGLAVEKLKEDLSSREWAALEGKYILGYSHEELSALLSVTPENMRSVVSRARRQARKILSDSDTKGDV